MNEHLKAAAILFRALLIVAACGGGGALVLLGVHALAVAFGWLAVGGGAFAILVLAGHYCAALDEVRGVKSTATMEWDGTDNA